MNREGGKRLCHAKVKEKDLKDANVRAAARNNREGDIYVDIQVYR